MVALDRLIGSSESNDKMNLVGKEVEGQAFGWRSSFYEVLGRFVELAGKRNELAFAARC